LNPSHLGSYDNAGKIGRSMRDSFRGLEPFEVAFHSQTLHMKKDRSHWPVHVVSSFEEADEVDFAFYESLTPQQRLDIMVELVGRIQHGANTGLERIHRVPKSK
jgi:hypothetical protein